MNYDRALRDEAIYTIANNYLSKVDTVFHTSVWLEYNRFKLLNDLQMLFKSLTRKWKFNKRKMFSRYLWVAKMTETIAIDPIIPNTSTNCTINTTYYSLLDKGLMPDAANSIISKLDAKCQELINKLSHLPSYHESIQLDSRLTFKDVTFSIKPTALNHLRSLYTGTNFYNDVYILLARYNALCDDNQQSGIPEPVMSYLSSIGFTYEAFASPFNSLLTNYSSVFDDTDAVFGSQGNFLTRDTYTQCEVNPPFIEEMLLAVAIKVVTENINCVLITPAWDDTPACKYLSSSGKVRSRLVLQPQQYKYRSGRSYTDNTDSFVAPFSSYIYVMCDITDIQIDNILSKFR